MEIEIIQGPRIIQTVAGPPCKECEEDKAQKDLQEELQMDKWIQFLKELNFLKNKLIDY